VVNGQLLAPGQRISEKQLLDVMSTAKLAVGLLDMGINESFSWDRFIEIFPEDMKNPTEEAAEWLAQLKIRLSGHDPSAG
jgi:kynurenine formamidase